MRFSPEFNQQADFLFDIPKKASELKEDDFKRIGAIVGALPSIISGPQYIEVWKKMQNLNVSDEVCKAYLAHANVAISGTNAHAPADYEPKSFSRVIESDDEAVNDAGFTKLK